MAAVPLYAHPTSAETVLTVHASHDDVLPTWLAAIAAGRVQAPARVLHFDAHPDLAAPIARPTSADPLAGVDIASFQLAATFLGAVDEIVWLRPSWAFQLPDGDHSFRVGHSGGRLRVDATFDYYVLDDSHSKFMLMSNKLPEGATDDTPLKDWIRSKTS